MVPEQLRVAHPPGVTLAELIVVLAVGGVITAASVPMLWTYVRSAALRAGAEETAAVLNTARQLAIRLNTTVCVTHDGTAVQYRVSGCTAPAWTGPGTDGAGDIRLASTLSVGGTNNLCFNHVGAGTAAPGACVANGTLRVTHPTGGTMSVVMATTGRIRIQ